MGMRHWLAALSSREEQMQEAKKELTSSGTPDGQATWFKGVE
jgi:hypothetical protein